MSSTTTSVSARTGPDLRSSQEQQDPGKSVAVDGLPLGRWSRSARLYLRHALCMSNTAMSLRLALLLIATSASPALANQPDGSAPDGSAPALRVSARAGAGVAMIADGGDDKAGGGFTTRLSVGSQVRVLRYVTVGMELGRATWHGSLYPTDEWVVVPTVLGERRYGGAAIQLGAGIPIRLLRRDAEFSETQVVESRSTGLGFEGILGGELLLGESWAVGLQFRWRLGGFFGAEYDAGEYEEVFGHPPDRSPKNEGFFLGCDLGAQLSYRH